MKVIVVNRMEDPTDWVKYYGAGTPTLNTSNFKQGTGSINLIKDRTDFDYASIKYTFPSQLNLFNMDLRLHRYLSDTSLVASSGDWLYIRFYTDAGIYQFSYPASDVTPAGWGLLTGSTGTSSPSHFKHVNAISVRVYTDNAADLITEGQLCFDNLIFLSKEIEQKPKIVKRFSKRF